VGAKRPKAQAVVPGSTRVPKKADDLLVGEDIELASSKPCWDFALMDHDYSGSWDWALDAAEHQQFARFLTEMQRLTWRDIWNQTSGGHRKHHDQATSSLCKEAKDRLRELRLDEQEKIFRFRLAGPVRLWGFFIGAEHQFRLLWWDRAHQVYPTEKS
jgi:hypothetical protein